MALLTRNQIKRKVGEAWALIYNPMYSEKTGAFLKGELKEFNKNKKSLIDLVASDKNPKKHFTIVWFGEEPDEKLLLNFF